MAQKLTVYIKVSSLVLVRIQFVRCVLKTCRSLVTILEGVPVIISTGLGTLENPWKANFLPFFSSMFWLKISPEPIMAGAYVEVFTNAIEWYVWSGIPILGFYLENSLLFNYKLQESLMEICSIIQVNTD